MAITLEGFTVTRKLIALALAMVINGAVLFGFHAWNASVLANAAAPRAQAVVTLPTITVRPSRAELELLRRDERDAASACQTSRAGATCRADKPHAGLAWAG